MKERRKNFKLVLKIQKMEDGYVLIKESALNRLLEMVEENKEVERWVEIPNKKEIRNG